ncbi:hypothetical protein BHM03_00060019, partial [Ensete ventricosum]
MEPPGTGGRRKKSEKKRENMDIQRHSSSTILIRRRPPSLDAADEMSPRRLRRQGLGVIGDFSSSARGDEALTTHPRREKKRGDIAVLY